MNIELIITGATGIIGAISGTIAGYYVQKSLLKTQFTKNRELEIFEKIYVLLYSYKLNLEKGEFNDDIKEIRKYIHLIGFIPLKKYKKEFQEIIDINNELLREKRKIITEIWQRIHKYVPNKGQFYSDEYGYSCIPTIPQEFAIGFISQKEAVSKELIKKFLTESEEMVIDEIGFNEEDKPQPKIREKDFIRFDKLFTDEKIIECSKEGKNYFDKLINLIDKNIKRLEKRL